MIILGVLAALAVPIVSLMFYGMGEIRRLAIHEVDLSKVPDGTFDGTYHKGRWRYDVEVTVQNHRIVAVKNQKPQPEPIQDFTRNAERAMLEKQSIAVDVVSGASLNTKAFSKAVEVALSTNLTRH
jgi:uncharacterized protein with FMN-binding domain